MNFYLVFQETQHIEIPNDEGKEFNKTCSFPTAIEFPPSIPFPYPLPQYAWFDTLFSVKYGLYFNVIYLFFLNVTYLCILELELKGETISGEEIKLTKQLKFLPGFRDNFTNPKGEFKGPQVEMDKKMLLYSGTVSFKCKLNKSVYSLTPEDKPILSLQIRNGTRTRTVQSIVLNLSHIMTVNGWNWAGQILSRKKESFVPLTEPEIEVNVEPGKDVDIQVPINIDEDCYPGLPPSFISGSMELKYVLSVGLHIPGVMDDPERDIPIKFIISDISKYLQQETPTLITPRPSFNRARTRTSHEDLTPVGITKRLLLRKSR